jgi:excisionase family DNA binding protein
MPARVAPPNSRGLVPGKVLLTLDDAAFALSCGRTVVYELVQRGRLIAVGSGRGRKVTATSVRQYVDGLVSAVRRERVMPEVRQQ